MIRIQFIHNETQLRAAFNIRQQVFVIEQNVDPHIEYDEFEKTSRHFLCSYGNVPAGTARWRKTAGGIKLERFAVLKPYRGKGVGSALLQALLKDTTLPLQNADSGSSEMIYLHAQNQVIPFYEKHGFTVYGDEFEEAGILHHKMIYQPGRP